MPQEAWAFRPTPETDRTGGRHVYSVVEAPGDILVFSGLEGKVWFAQLGQGNTKELMRVPGNEGIYQLNLSAEGEYMTCMSQSGGRRGRTTERFGQVWNLKKLLERAAR